MSNGEKEFYAHWDSVSAAYGFGKEYSTAHMAAQAAWDAQASIIAALKEQLAQSERMFMAACEDLGAINEALGLDPNDGGADPILGAIEDLREDALEKAAQACENERVEDTVQDGDIGYNRAIEHAAAAIRALASQPAAPVQPANSENHPAWKRAIYYTDTLNGQQVSRDDLWAITTQELSALTDAAPPVQQPGDVRDAALAALLTRIDDAFENYERFGGVCQFEGSPMIYASTLTEIVELRGAFHVSALATTRPSAALTELQRRGLEALADRIEQSGNALPLFIDTTAAIAIRAILAASGGAMAVPEWISVDERLPDDSGDVLVLYWPFDNHENAQIVGQAHYHDGGFYNDDGNEWHPPSHWMPLPAAPAIPGGDK